MRQSLCSTTMIFAQSQSSVGSRPDCAGAKFALELEFVGIDAKPKVHRRVLLLLPLLLLLHPSRAEPPVMVRNLRRRRRNPPLPARQRAFRRRRFLRLAAPPPASRRALHRAARTLTSTTLFRRWASSGRPYSIDCDGRRPFFRERRRPGKGGVLGAARRRFGLADS